MARLRSTFHQIAERVDSDRRRALVEARRELAIQVWHGSLTCEPLFAIGGGTQLATDYRHHFSRMRAAIGLHQVLWSAVEIGDEPRAYRASSLVAMAVQDEFIVWIEGVRGTRSRHHPTCFRLRRHGLAAS